MSLKKLPLGGAKDEHFSFLQRSCKIGLRPKIDRWQFNPKFFGQFRNKKKSKITLELKLNTSAHKCLFRVFDDSDWKFRQIGVVHGSAASCDGSRFPGIFVRLDDTEVLNFIQREVFGSNSCKVSGKIFKHKNHLWALQYQPSTPFFCLRLLLFAAISCLQFLPFACW